jgi:U1 small nuclear ribonucleoprotein 70kDa
MTDKLPPNLLALFAPRPPLRYLPHPDHASEERHTRPIDGVAAFLPALQEKKATLDDEEQTGESWFERKVRKKAEKKEKLQNQLKEGIDDCKS